MEIKQVTIPNVNDINFYQIGLIQEFTSKGDEIDVEDVVFFLSQYLDIDQKDLENAFISDVKGLYATVLDSFNDLQDTEIQETIEVNGELYTFRANDKLPAIWFMTSQRVIAQGATLPYIAALCYIEEGKSFQDTDFEKRAETFDKHMTYATYAPLNAFFLEKWSALQELSSLIGVNLKQNPLHLMKL